MKVTDEMVKKAMDEIKESGMKLPYTKQVSHNMWEVFTGDTVCFMGKEQHELYIKALKGFA